MSDFSIDEGRRLWSEIASRTGLNFRDRQIEQLQQTVLRAMAQEGCTSIREFRQRLNSSPGAFDDFVGQLTVGETFFFRDPDQFEVIRNRILPELRKQRGVHGDPRMWSAGCASGEEAYSLAVLLEESDPGGRGRVLATDISRPALQRAREAIFRKWSLRGESQRQVQNYLTKRDGLYILDERIRRRVVFDYLNLAADVYPSLATDTWGLDLILCRNVLIYFDRETIARVLRRLWNCLAPGGWLVLGASDPHAADFVEFEVITTSSGLMYRRAAEVPLDSGSSESGGIASHGTSSQSRAMGSNRDSSAIDADGSSSRGGEGTAESQGAVGDDEFYREPRESGQSVSETQAAMESMCDPLDSEAASVVQVRTLINQNVEQAENLCGRFLVRYPLSLELRFIRAVLLMDLGRMTESAEQFRKLLFLDRSVVIAHFTQGTVMRQLNQIEAARRSFRNTIQLCSTLEPQSELLFGDGETAERLQQAASRQLELLTPESFRSESEARS